MKGHDITEPMRLRILKLLGQKIPATLIAERLGLHESSIRKVAKDLRRNEVLSEALSK